MTPMHNNQRFSRRAVFFTAGLGAQFASWAAAKPRGVDLLRIMEEYRDEYIVVAPAIIPMDGDLLDILKKERQHIWHDR
jgi:hypothetical protein